MNRAAKIVIASNAIIAVLMLDWLVTLPRQFWHAHFLPLGILTVMILFPVYTGFSICRGINTRLKTDGADRQFLMSIVGQVQSCIMISYMIMFYLFMLFIGPSGLKVPSF